MATSVMTAASHAQPSSTLSVPQQPRLMQQTPSVGYPVRTGRRYRQQMAVPAVDPQPQQIPAIGQPGAAPVLPQDASTAPLTPSYPQVPVAYLGQQQNTVLDTESYRRVERPKEVTPDDEVRVTATGRPTRYITYASKLFKEQQRRALTLRATGAAVSVAVAVCEVVKRRFRGLHQVTQIGWTEIVDEWEPLKPGLEPYTKKRSLPSLSITLTFDDSTIDKSAPGYQPPLDDSLVEERDTEALLRPAFARPRRPRSRRQRNPVAPLQPTLAGPSALLTTPFPRTVAPAILPGSMQQQQQQAQLIDQQQRVRRNRARRNNRRRLQFTIPEALQAPVEVPSPSTQTQGQQPRAEALQPLPTQGIFVTPAAVATVSA